MSLEQRARDAGADVRHQVTTLDDPEADVIARRSRRGRMVTAVAAVVVVSLAGVGLAVALHDDGHPASTELEVVHDPEPPTIPRDALVWYDARGLHHGDVVEQTPVVLAQRVGDDSISGVLALVRSGAMYLDPANGDVWLHPWAGEPRIVGHNSQAGPGGDPEGDTAAWFEGSELVVYDTAAGREISRTEQGGNVAYRLFGDHWPPGNGFQQVSDDGVVWTTGSGTYRHDLRTGTTSLVELPSGRFLADVHDQIEATGQVGAPDGSLVLRVPGQADERYPDLEAAKVRLSPSGNYLLAVEDTDERHGAVIVDIRTGDVWPVPRDVYPWISWSYGDIALVDHTGDALLACDAARRVCERLGHDGELLLPTN